MQLFGIKNRLIHAALCSTFVLSCTSKPKNFDSRTELLVEVLYCNDSRNDPSSCVIKYKNTLRFDEGVSAALLNNQIKRENEKVKSIIGSCDDAGFHIQDGIRRMYPDIRANLELFNPFPDGSKFVRYSNHQQANPELLCVQSP